MISRLRLIDPPDAREEVRIALGWHMRAIIDSDIAVAGSISAALTSGALLQQFLLWYGQPTEYKVPAPNLPIMHALFDRAWLAAQLEEEPDDVRHALFDGLFGIEGG